LGMGACHAVAHVDMLVQALEALAVEKLHKPYTPASVGPNPCVYCS
jgi:hypothetical protein